MRMFLQPNQKLSTLVTPKKEVKLQARVNPPKVIHTAVSVLDNPPMNFMQKTS